MKQTLLIAWREYKQYVFSRGFLLFLVLMPIGVVAFGAAMGLIERSKPTRTFVIYDQTGSYADDIDREIERRHLFDGLVAWNAYVSANAKEGVLPFMSDEPSPIPEPFGPGEASDKRLRAFLEAGGFEAAKQAAAPYLRDEAPDFVMPKPEFARADLPASVLGATSMEAVEEALRPYLLDERKFPGADGEPVSLFAAVLIPEGFGLSPDAPGAQYWSRNLTDTVLQNVVENALQSALQREAIVVQGLPEAALDEVAAISAQVDAYRPDREAEQAQLSLQDRIETQLPAALTYMLLVIIFGVGNLLLTNTIEERSNKIVEILLSSVTAGQLMMGKLVGIAAVGLTMPLLFLVGGFAGLGAISSTGNDIMTPVMGALFSSPLLLVYLFYFVCAYAIFSMIFLAIGAMSNSLQDAQSYMGPVMFLVFAPMPFMIMVYQNPNGFIASVLTWIPIYTPYAVMMRATASPPLWEIVGATALMLAFAIFLMRIMGRVFRNAILQSSPPKARDVWRLLRREGA